MDFVNLEEIYQKKAIYNMLEISKNEKMILIGSKLENSII